MPEEQKSRPKDENWSRFLGRGQVKGSGRALEAPSRGPSAVVANAFFGTKKP